MIQRIVITSMAAILFIASFTACSGDSASRENPADNPTSTAPGVARVIGSQGMLDGQFIAPESIAIGRSGNLYVVDSFNNRVQKLTPTGEPILSWGSEGSGDGEFYGCRGIAVDSEDNVYVTDTILHRVQKFDASGNFLAKWGSEGANNGEFSAPFDVAVDSTDTVFIVDANNNRVQIFSSSGVFLGSFGTAGTGDGQFDGPAGITLDRNDNVYIADGNNDRIQKFDKNGKFIATWGTTGTDNGEFETPYGLSTDAAGNIYVTDMGNHRIQKFTSSGAFLGKAGQEGEQDGELFEPADIAIDRYDNIYVVDESNHRVQLFTQEIFTASVAAPPETTVTEITGSGVAKASWMRDLAGNPRYAIGSAPLTLLGLPGTHDSGTYGITIASDMADDGNFNGPQAVTDTTGSISHWCHKTWWTPHWLCSEIDHLIDKVVNPVGTVIAKSVQAPWSTSQNQTILQQLNGGIRFFDLRVQAHKNSFYIVHSMVGSNIDTILNDIKTFCNQPHSSQEIVLVAFRNYKMNAALDEQLIGLIKTKLVNSSGQSLLIPRTSNFATFNLNTIWNGPGRVIVFYSDSSDNHHAIMEKYPELWFKNAGDSNAIDTPSTLVNFWPDTRSTSDLLSVLPAKRKAFLSLYGANEVAPGAGSQYKNTFYSSQLLRTQNASSIKKGIESAIFSKFTGKMNATARYLFKKGWRALGLSTDKPGNLLDWGTETNKIIPEYFKTMNSISFSTTNQVSSYAYMLNLVMVDHYQSAPVDFVDQLITYNMKRHPL